MNEDSSGDNWEKAETSSGILYYINHKGKKTQWEHPKFTAALNSINECNSIKYAAYRTGAKVCVLQRTLGLDKVRVGLVGGVFQRHRIQVLENCLQLEYCELEAILSDIFFAASKEARLSTVAYNVEHLTELTLNFLISVFDKKHAGSIQVIAVKVALVSLCCSRLQEKYQYLFNQLADHNSCLSKRKLKLLLENFVCVTDFLCESLAFSSSLIPDTLESCFENKSHGPLGISEENFMCWVLKEPQLLVWLSTFYRMRAAENVSHTVRCAVCRTYPIRGLRYRCLHCISYDQCQMCFFHGRTSKRHKLKHPMQEYCWQTSHKEATVSFLKALVNRLCGNTSRLQYLPAQPCDTASSGSASPSLSTSSSNITAVELMSDIEQQSQIVRYANINGVVGGNDDDDCGIGNDVVPWIDSTLQPQKELQSIINKLEAENRQLELDIERLCGLDQDRVGHSLKEHRALIEAQVRRLKLLKQHLQSIGPKALKVQSTPITVQDSAALMLYKSPQLSPIINNQNWSTDTMNFNHNKKDEYSLSDLTSGCLSTWLGGRDTVITEPRSGFSDWLGTPNAAPNSTPCPRQGLPYNENERPFQDQSHIDELQQGLDNILFKLQNMLASNFSLSDDISGEEK
ncbi:dystrophin-like [Lycorma delicatula]|uniref:dystrophin-like n=1 Tax=Lycorma delicatula TaxID=130591 RepID=UPI003F51A875